VTHGDYELGGRRSVDGDMRTSHDGGASGGNAERCSSSLFD